MLMLTIGNAVHNNAENDTPLCILGLVWVRVPILFGNELPGSHLSYSKKFMKFGSLELKYFEGCRLTQVVRVLP